LHSYVPSDKSKRVYKDCPRCHVPLDERSRQLAFASVSNDDPLSTEEFPGAKSCISESAESLKNRALHNIWIDDFRQGLTSVECKIFNLLNEGYDCYSDMARLIGIGKERTRQVTTRVARKFNLYLHDCHMEEKVFIPMQWRN